jgi:hypothetical protein
LASFSLSLNYLNISFDVFVIFGIFVEMGQPGPGESFLAVFYFDLFDQDENLRVYSTFQA